MRIILPAFWAAVGVIAGITAVQFAGAITSGFLSFGVNETDKSSWNRSGVDLVTDYGTGCQYLKSSLSGLTPRLGRDGKQICTD